MRELEVRELIMVSGVKLELMADVEDGFLIEMFADDLQSDRQIPRGESTGN